MTDRTQELECVIADLTLEAKELRAELDALKKQVPSRPELITPYQAPEEIQDYCIEAAEGYADGWNGCIKAMLAAAPQPERSAYRSQALDDVIAERRRQIEVKGWTPEHDDEHANGEMALAAAAYAVSSVETGDSLQCAAMLFHRTGWAKYWFKPSSPRRDLVKAVALGLAELERKDRAERSAGDEREGV